VDPDEDRACTPTAACIDVGADPALAGNLADVGLLARGHIAEREAGFAERVRDSCLWRGEGPQLGPCRLCFSLTAVSAAGYTRFG